MAKVKITCDSTCDLTRELYQKNQVSVLSMGVSLGDDFRLDGVNVQADDLYDYVEKTGSLPKTCAISLGDYQEAFSKWVKEGYEVVHISLSSKLSTSHQSACIAAEEVGNVYVVDSKSLSTGSGHLVLLACQAPHGGPQGQAVQSCHAKKPVGQLRHAGLPEHLGQAGLVVPGDFLGGHGARENPAHVRQLLLPVPDAQLLVELSLPFKAVGGKGGLIPVEPGLGHNPPQHKGCPSNQGNIAGTA